MTSFFQVLLLMAAAYVEGAGSPTAALVLVLSALGLMVVRNVVNDHKGVAR